MPETINETYVRKNPKSAALFPRFKNVFPSGGGGHDGYVADPFPITIDHGKGPRKWDVDGNEYIDYLGSWGPLVLGHAHPVVVQALHKAAEGGTSFGAPVEQEVELAKIICGSLPSVEMVRLVNSGTEACMA